MTADERLADVLKAKGYAICKSCGRNIDRGDIAWNNGSTEVGTPCTFVEIICARCDNQVARIHSWYPGIEDMDELTYVIENDG